MPDYCEDQHKDAMARHQCGSEQAAAFLEEELEAEEMALNEAEERRMAAKHAVKASVPGGKLTFEQFPGKDYLHAYGKRHDYLLTIDEGHTILSQFRKGEFEAVQRWRRKGSWSADAMRLAEKWEAGQ